MFTKLPTTEFQRLVLLVVLLLTIAILSFLLVSVTRRKQALGALAAEQEGFGSSITFDTDSKEALAEQATLAAHVNEVLLAKREVQQQVLLLQDEQQSQQPSSSSSSSTATAQTIRLQNVCILGSFQSACTGQYVSVKQLIYLLQIGVRVLDLEIFYDPNKEIPVIGTQSGTKNSVFITYFLSSLQKFILSGGLGNSTTLFLQYRIRTPARLREKKRTSYLADIANYTFHYLHSFLMNKEVQRVIHPELNPATFIVNDLFKPAVAAASLPAPAPARIVVVLDTTVCPFFKETGLQLLVDIHAGGDRTKTFFSNNLAGRNYQFWNVCLPDPNHQLKGPNPDSLQLFSKYQIQLPLLNFAVVDQALEDYLLVFHNGKAPYQTLDQVSQSAALIRHAHGVQP